jgi:hypothetical protein
LQKVVEAHLGFNWNLNEFSKELLAKTQWLLLLVILCSMELLNASSWVDNLRMLRVDEEWGFLVTTTCMVLGVSWVVSMLYRRLWQPYSRRRFYEKQGIRGPAFRPFIGNLPELRKLRAEVPKLGGHILESPARRVATELFVFSEKYGKKHL